MITRSGCHALPGEQLLERGGGLFQPVETLAEPRAELDAVRGVLGSIHAPPRPAIARPPEAWSIVVSIFATTPGLRNVFAPTSRPSWTREVTFDHAASVV